MSYFDETSGIVACETEFGRWWQTVDEVVIQVDLPEATRAKEISCTVLPSRMKVSVKQKTILEGQFPAKVESEDTIWTVEDQKSLRICLTKMTKTAGNCWASLFTDQYRPDPLTFDEMEKKMTLQRYQLEKITRKPRNSRKKAQLKPDAVTVPTIFSHKAVTTKTRQHTVKRIKQREREDKEPRHGF